MVAVAVTANNTRVDDAEADNGWSGIGGGQGPSAEGSFPYQGNNLVNKKITSTGGIYYDPTGDGGSAQDVTATAKAHWMVKGIVTDYGGLNATMGVAARIGSGTSAYYQICIAGTDAVKNSYDEYPPRGGILIVPVNPNIAAYRTTQGSPALGSADYFGFYVDLDTGTAKSENVGCDAIDLGTGLTLLSGTGANDPGVWKDFVDEDEGTVANRWGYAQSLYNNVKVFFGQMTVGSSGTATEFLDNLSQVLWPDGLFAAGFSRAYFDLGNASTVLHDGSLHTSLGTTNSINTKTDFVWVGTAGTGTASHTLINFRNYVMTSAVTLDDARIEIEDLALSGGEVKNSAIICTSATNVAVCNDVVFGTTSGIHDCDIIQGPNGAGHAFEITSTTTINLTNLTFTGFGGTAGSNGTANSGASDAAIYNNSGGALTINVLGTGNTPSIRNGAGSTTTVVVGQKNFTQTISPVPSPNYEYRLYEVTAEGSLDGAVEITAEGEESSTSGSHSYSHTETNQPVAVQIISNDYVEKIAYYTLTASDLSVTINLDLDNND